MSNSGDASFGPMLMLASGMKMSAAPKPEIRAPVRRERQIRR
jgi:hypothetical protein